MLNSDPSPPALAPRDTPGAEAATPTMRLFAVLEALPPLGCHFTLQEIVERTGLPKPTLHRMLQQLEAVGMLQRERDERHYAMAPRLRSLAHGLLMQDQLHGARHAVLRQLSNEVGESVNLTTIASAEVVYLDRVETAAPLRFSLHPGSRVPLHASATGKLFLSVMAPAQQRRVLGSAPLERLTERTLVDAQALAAEIERTRARGWGLDDEEYLPGLVCVAVLVPRANGDPPQLGVALQAPALRLSVHDAQRHLPALRRAAAALGQIENAALARDGDAGAIAALAAP